LQLNFKPQKYTYWLTFTGINLTSLYFKLGDLDFVEYKYDQQFAFNVLNNCRNGEIFNYIDSSAGVPAGPLLYLYECVGGIFGITSYKNLLIFEILISHFLLLVLFYFLNSKVNNYSNLLIFSFLALNPYLIVIGRNPGVTAHYELFTVLFLYFFIYRNDKKKNSFYLGVISTLAFAAYIPIFVTNICVLGTSLAFKKLDNIKNVIYGCLVGSTIALLLFVPYFLNNNLITPSSRSGSWGLSSFWRILLDLQSGKSIIVKVQHVDDYALLNSYYPQFDVVANLNYFLIFLILLYSIQNLIKKFFSQNISDFDVLFFSSLIVSGVVFTLFDIPLYAHYLLSLIVLIYIYTFSIINKKILTVVLIVFFTITNIYLNSSFFNFIEINNGAHRSDYGKVYNICGCCTENIKECKGQ
tara:strand:+ start:188 stop:1423 length:1236 start_codon:yes stop_codon:yes gene_type:complete